MIPLPVAARLGRCRARDVQSQPYRGTLVFTLSRTTSFHFFYQRPSFPPPFNKTTFAISFEFCKVPATKGTLLDVEEAKRVCS